MIAVTIGVGGKHEMLASLAAESCSRRTGLEVRILDGAAMKRQNVVKPHHLKFRIFDELPGIEDVLYFDADIIFLKDFDARSFANSRELVAVRDMISNPVIARDAANLGISPDDYFNSGLLVLNRTRHLALLRSAESHELTFPAPFHDQTALNAARHRLGIPLRLLPKEFNYLEFENVQRPKDIVIAHVSGIERRPGETIRHYHRFWARNGVRDSEALRAAKARLIAQPYDYDRVGRDVRRMEFKSDGGIGIGAARCEKQWEMTEVEGTVILWIIGDYQPICALTENEQGVWSGRWMRFEQMPVRLQPLSSHAICKKSRPVEVVLLNWRRPDNIRQIVDAFASQRNLCSITLIDAPASPEFAVDATTRASVDRLFIFSDNFGCYTRYIPLETYSAHFTYFHDDDMLPGTSLIETLLRFGQSCQEYGVLGQEGRIAQNGSYSANPIRADSGIRDVDFVVRGYFVRTSLLRNLPLWSSAMGLSKVREDDMFLCSAARHAGFKIGVVPLNSEKEKMNFRELPAPYASSANSNHIASRNEFIKRLRACGWSSIRDQPLPSFSRLGYAEALLRRLPGSHAIGAVIGVHEELLPSYLLAARPALQLIVADPTASPVDGAHPRTSEKAAGEINSYKRDRSRTMVIDSTAFSRERRVIVGRESEAAAALVADESLDFVLCNQSDSIENLRHSVAVWLPKIKAGGILCWRDRLGHKDESQALHALNEIAQTIGATLEGDEDGTWFMPVTKKSSPKYGTKVRSTAPKAEREWKVLAYRRTNNLGDAIQTACVTRLVTGRLHGIYRDAVHVSGAPRVPFLVNGYLRDKPGPASDEPVFCGVHCANSAAVTWCRKSSRVVGARDPHSMKLLGAAGVESRLVGCATLTLPRYSGPRQGVYAVDMSRWPGEMPSESIQLTNYLGGEVSWQQQWDMAVDRLNVIRQAEVVYTSRLHIILPCLAFGTPVYCPSDVPRLLRADHRFSLLESLGFRYGEVLSLDVSLWAVRFKAFLSDLTGCDVGNRDPTFPAVC